MELIAGVDLPGDYCSDNTIIQRNATIKLKDSKPAGHSDQQISLLRLLLL